MGQLIRAHSRLGSGKRSLLVGAAAVSLLGLSGQALAQSSASSQMEEVVVTGRRQVSIGGLIQPEQLAKTRSTVDEAFILKQPAGQTPIQTINLLPGVNFTNNDPYGASGGNIRIRGFDGNRVSLTLDGIPLNDTGNYALFTSQLVDSEVIRKISVNLGTTDVDSPTASATGGTINILSRIPSDEPGALFVPTFGNFAYKRFAARLETGKLGPWNTTALLQGSYTNYNKFKGPGELDKKQINGRVYQDLGSDDFVSLALHYSESRNNFYRNPTKAQFQTLGDEFENLPDYVRDAPTAGVRDDDGIGAAANGSNFYGVRVNPSNTGNIRAQSSFGLTDGVRLTFDPYFQYTLAHGGGSTVIGENDFRLIGRSSAAGVDLNGDGDLVDAVRVYSPNITNTFRPGLTSSLIWEINDEHKVRASYTWERGRHRQTGAFGRLGADGHPENLFAGRNGTPIATADGNILRGRDRYSVAELNQVSGEYSGRFFDDRLRVVAGVRAPFFHRELSQNCWVVQTLPASAGTLVANQYCTTAAAPPAAASGTIRAPFTAEKNFDAVLPNVGVTWRFTDEHQVYASFAEGLSAPRTDDLYDINIPNAVPERTKSYDIGYRYQSGMITGSIAGWYTRYSNRIVRAFDQDLSINLARNVGPVDMKGFDAEVGFRPIDGLTAYLSASYIDTEVKEDVRVSGTAVEPTKGKQLVETPDWTFGGRVEYTFEGVTAGFQGKYVGRRYATDVNDEVAPSYAVFDLDLGYEIPNVLGMTSAGIRFNITNLFDERYLGSVATSQVRALGTGGNAPLYAIGAPRTYQVSLRAEF